MSERTPQFEDLNIAGASVCLVARTPFHTDFDVLAIQRDYDPTIPYPGEWEFPGGALELGETAVQCALRELYEETGLAIPEEWIDWEAFYPRAERNECGELIYTAFYSAKVNRFRLPKPKCNEGQTCCWMPAATFTGLQPMPGTTKQLKAIRDHRERYDDFLAGDVGGTPHAIGQKILRNLGVQPLK